MLQTLNEIIPPGARVARDHLCPFLSNQSVGHRVLELKRTLVITEFKPFIFLTRKYKRSNY